MNFFALDNDLYKFTMQQAVLHNYPDAWVKYRYKIRNPKILANMKNLDKFYELVSKRISLFGNTRFTSPELDYMLTIPFMKKDYIDFLEDFTFKTRYIHITQNTKTGFDLYIEGPWVQTILFEVPLLYIISETYSELVTEGLGEIGKMLQTEQIGLQALEKQLPAIGFNDLDIKISDFGTRRRFTQRYHEKVIQFLIEKLKKSFVGTSNVYFAMKYGVKPIGTMAHEWLQAHQALYRVSDSQKAALEAWSKEYRGNLGIALSDVVGFDAFLRDFDPYFAKLFDGCRHDSGDPYEWGHKLIKHYMDLKIDPKTKSAVFSDGLTIAKALELHQHFKRDIKTAFGIGTALSNIASIQPPQIVIKMVECNGKAVAKVSDSEGKGMCEDESYLKYLKHVFYLDKPKWVPL